MSNASARRPATTRHGWLLLLLAPALIVGIVLMHSLMSAPAVDGMPAMDDSMASVAMAHPAVATHAATVPIEADDPMGHGTGGMPDCGGLMAMCLALLMSFVALVSPRGRFRWVLWRHPPPTSVPLGTLRGAFEAMTARQRTTVIRC